MSALQALSFQMEAANHVDMAKSLPMENHVKPAKMAQSHHLIKNLAFLLIPAQPLVQLRLTMLLVFALSLYLSTTVNVFVNVASD